MRDRCPRGTSRYLHPVGVIVWWISELVVPPFRAAHRAADAGHQPQAVTDLVQKELPPRMLGGRKIVACGLRIKTPGIAQLALIGNLEVSGVALRSQVL